jgi:hypothetical protein
VDAGERTWWNSVKHYLLHTGAENILDNR